MRADFKKGVLKRNMLEADRNQIFPTTVSTDWPQWKPNKWRLGLLEENAVKGVTSSDCEWSGGGMPMMELSHMTGCQGRRTGFAGGTAGCGGRSGSELTSTYSSSSRAAGTGELICWKLAIAYSVNCILRHYKASLVAFTSFCNMYNFLKINSELCEDWKEGIFL